MTANRWPAAGSVTRPPLTAVCGSRPVSTAVWVAIVAARPLAASATATLSGTTSRKDWGMGTTRASEITATSNGGFRPQH